jgi:hypothetical protein
VGTGVFLFIQWVPEFFFLFNGYRSFSFYSMGTGVFLFIQWVPEFFFLFSGYRSFSFYLMGTGVFLFIQWVPEFFLRKSGHHVSRLRMSGAIPVIPLYAFMMQIGRNLHLFANQFQ